MSEEKKLCEVRVRKTGEVLEVRHDGHHHRAYNKEGLQKSNPWIKLDDLSKELDAEPVTPEPPAARQEPEQQQAHQESPAASDMEHPDRQPPADVTKCGQHLDGECMMDDTKCDGQCGEHADRAAKKAGEKQPAPETPPEQPKKKKK